MIKDNDILSNRIHRCLQLKVFLHEIPITCKIFFNQHQLTRFNPIFLCFIKMLYFSICAPNCFCFIAAFVLFKYRRAFISNIHLKHLSTCVVLFKFIHHNYKTKKKRFFITYSHEFFLFRVLRKFLPPLTSLPCLTRPPPPFQLPRLDVRTKKYYCVGN